MSLHLIPEDQVEKNRLRNPGSVKIEVGTVKIEYPRERMRKTPFTRYDIVERDGNFYIEIPDGIDEIFS